AGARKRVQADGERLGDGGLGEGRAGPDLLALEGLGHDEVAEAALLVGKPHRRAVEAHMQAMLAQALSAVAAGIARPARIERHAIAGDQPFDALSNRLDGARQLVTEDDRLAHADRAETAVVEVVQVRAADAAGADAHQHLIIGRRSDGLALDTDVMRAVETADA